MAARKVRGEVRHRKVTVFARPPDLNVILEAEGLSSPTEDHSQSLSQDQGQNQGHGQDQVQTKGQGQICLKCQGQGRTQNQCQCQIDKKGQGQILSQSSNEGQHPNDCECPDQKLGQGQIRDLSECQGQNGHHKGCDKSNNGENRLGYFDTVESQDNFAEEGPRRLKSSNILSKNGVPQQIGRLGSVGFAQIPSPKGQRKVSGIGDEIGRLKQYTARLNLPTRRASYVTWRQQHFGQGNTPLMTLSPTSEEADDVTWTPERRHRMDAMLQSIRDDLQALREEDQALARRLMALRRSIHELRVSRYTEANRDLLDEAMFDAERDELDDICDLPPRLFNPDLKHYGVTRMNVQTRRFSVF